MQIDLSGALRRWEIYLGHCTGGGFIWGTEQVGDLSGTLHRWGIYLGHCTGGGFIWGTLCHLTFVVVEVRDCYCTWHLFCFRLFFARYTSIHIIKKNDELPKKSCVNASQRYEGGRGDNTTQFHCRSAGQA